MNEVTCDKCGQLNYSVAKEDSFFCCSCGAALKAEDEPVIPDSLIALGDT